MKQLLVVLVLCPTFLFAAPSVDVKINGREAAEVKPYEYINVSWNSSREIVVCEALAPYGEEIYSALGLSSRYSNLPADGRVTFIASPDILSRSYTISCVYEEPIDDIQVVSDSASYTVLEIASTSTSLTQIATTTLSTSSVSIQVTPIWRVGKKVNISWQTQAPRVTLSLLQNGNLHMVMKRNVKKKSTSWRVPKNIPIGAYILDINGTQTPIEIR